MSIEEESLDQYQARLHNVNELRNIGIDPYPARIQRTHTAKNLHEKYQNLANSEETQDIVMVAGRIISIRNSGMFIDLHDDGAKIQIYCDVKNLDEHNKQIISYINIGDIISVKGNVRRTPRGELSVRLKEIKVAAKALLPLPDKYHGINDVEVRYRHRYLDLIANQEPKEVLFKRSLIISSIRNTLTNEGFLEVETPMLHPIAGGAIAKPFKTHHNALDSDFYLRIAPELYLKKLIVGGLSEKIFEINRCFRNEGISTRHNPEFTSMELYQAYADYNDMIGLTELIIKNVCNTINKTLQINFLDKAINFEGPWARKSMVELVKEQTGINFLDVKDAEEAHKVAKSLGIKLSGKESWGKVLEEIFAEKVEHLLIQPTHVTDLPTDISPLSKSRIDDPRLTERFETYMNGWEIANGFSELNDPVEQKKRFLQQVESKEAGDEEAHEMDHDFINALEYAMPPTGGLGIGIDRLVMIMTNSHSIREVIAFPTLKPKI